LIGENGVLKSRIAFPRLDLAQEQPMIQFTSIWVQALERDERKCEERERGLEKNEGKRLKIHD
jgi:hypothetical protein